MGDLEAILWVRDGLFTFGKNIKKVGKKLKTLIKNKKSFQFTLKWFNKEKVLFKKNRTEIFNDGSPATETVRTQCIRDGFSILGNNFK